MCESAYTCVLLLVCYKERLVYNCGKPILKWSQDRTIRKYLLTPIMHGIQWIGIAHDCSNLIIHSKALVVYSSSFTKQSNVQNNI